MSVPLLELVRARIDVEGVPAVDGLSLNTSDDRVLVLGAARAMFEAVIGIRLPAHGEVRVRGVDARRAARTRVAAGAPYSARLPSRWTVRQYVTWSARVAGLDAREARASADHALAELKMGPVASDRLGETTPQARRSTSIAAAFATGAAAVILEEPVLGMSDEAARNFARVVLRALDKRPWIVFAARLALESPFAMDAGEAVVVHGASAVAQGAPAELASRTHAYAVRVIGEGDAFARLAAERGARVTGTGAELTVDLGESLRVRDLFRTAADAHATLIELRPVAHAFA